MLPEWERISLVSMLTDLFGKRGQKMSEAAKMRQKSREVHEKKLKQIRTDPIYQNVISRIEAAAADGDSEMTFDYSLTNETDKKLVERYIVPSLRKEGFDVSDPERMKIKTIFGTILSQQSGEFTVRWESDE